MYHLRIRVTGKKEEVRNMLVHRLIANLIANLVFAILCTATSCVVMKTFWPDMPLSLGILLCFMNFAWFELLSVSTVEINITD